MAAAALKAVWICSFPSSARLRAEVQTETHDSRRPAPAQAHDASQYKYKRWKRAAESGLARLGFAVDQQLTAQGCHALGVVVVKPGLVWDGPLSPWPEQRAYHQHAEDAYYMEVVEMYPFAQPKRLHLRRDGYRGAEVAITLSAGCMVLQPLGLSGSQPIPGQSTPPRLTTLTPRHALQLAAPLADVVVRGSMKKVAFMSRWTRLWSEFLPPGWHGRIRTPADGFDLSSKALSARSASLVSKLQAWAPTLLQHAAGDSAALRLEPENEVSWLQALAASGTQGGGSDGSQAALLYFRAASEFKSVHSLPAVIAMVAAAQLASQKGGAIEMASDQRLIPEPTAKSSVKAPSATTLRRMCLCQRNAF